MFVTILFNTRIMNRIIRHLISKCDISSVILIMKSVQISVSVCNFISGLLFSCFFLELPRFEPLTFPLKTYHLTTVLTFHPRILI